MLVPSLSYDNDLAVVRGGLRDGMDCTGLLHLRLRWVLPTASAWRGTSAFIDVRNIHGGHVSQLAGDAQGVSNVDGPDGTALHELWVQHDFEWSGVSLLGGVYDVNSEFDRLDGTALFLNSSFGVTPEFAESGTTGPSIFPRTAAALRLSVKPGSGSVLRAALVDGQSLERPDGSHALFKRGDGALAILEWSMLRRPEATGDETPAPRIFGRFSPSPTYEDKVAVGLWRYSKRLSDAGFAHDAAGAPRHTSEGGYVIGEWRLLGRGEEATNKVSGFAQFGLASPAGNRFGSYVGGGLVATGWLARNEADQIGVSVASARNGGAWRRSAALAGARPTQAETTWELSYLAQVNKRLTLEPDLQFVAHPNANAALRDALVFQLRSEISL